MKDERGTATNQTGVPRISGRYGGGIGLPLPEFQTDVVIIGGKSTLSAHLVVFPAGGTAEGGILGRIMLD